MRSPAVSGAQSYMELCTAAKNEEWRLAELQKRQQYSWTKVLTPQDHTSKEATDSKPLRSECSVLGPATTHLLRIGWF